MSMAKRNSDSGVSAGRRNVVGMAVASILVTAGVLLFTTLTDIDMQLPNKPINAVNITGELHHANQQDIRARITPLLSDGFMGVDLAAVQNELLMMEWIAQAVVSRSWPDTLEVSLTEHVPLARWGANALLSRSGEVFVPRNIESFVALPALSGSSGRHAEVLSRYVELNQLLAPKRLRVTNLELNDTGRWLANLQSGTQLVFGKDDLIAKTRRFLIVYERELEVLGDRVQSVDLRYSNGLAVKWKTVVESNQSPLIEQKS